MRPDTILSTGTGVALPHVPDNHQVWPFALVARHYLDGFIDCYNRAVRTSEEWIRALGRHGAFTIDRVPSGTNLLRLRVGGTDPASLHRRLASARLMLAPPQNGAFLIGAAVKSAIPVAAFVLEEAR